MSPYVSFINHFLLLFSDRISCYYMFAKRLRHVGYNERNIRWISITIKSSMKQQYQNKRQNDPMVLNITRPTSLSGALQDESHLITEIEGRRTSHPVQCCQISAEVNHHRSWLFWALIVDCIDLNQKVGELWALFIESSSLSISVNGGVNWANVDSWCRVLG